MKPFLVSGALDPDERVPGLEGLDPLQARDLICLQPWAH